MTSGGSLPFRVAAALLAVFWGLLFYGLIDLLAFLQGAEFHATVLLSTGWGLVFLVLVAGPLAAIAVASRGSRAAVAEVTLVAAAVGVAAALSSSPRHGAISVGLVMTVGLVALLGGPRPVTTGWRWSTAPAAVLAVAIVPAVSYAWTAARSTGTGRTTDDTWGFDHWPVQAALPIALLLVAALAAGHPHGWRLPLWTGTAATLWFGAVALAEPSLVGSLDRGWAVAVLVWSVAFLVLTTHSAPSEA